MDVVRGELDVHQVVSDTEASSYEPGHRLYDEQSDVLVSHVLLRTAGDDRSAGDARYHCTRALSAKHARSFAPRSGPPPDLQFHVRDEADDAMTT